jgi:insertion element IS1 protein InsB
MIKYGKTKSGSQRYICRVCGKTRVENYIYQAYEVKINQNIILLTIEGLEE